MHTHNIGLQHSDTAEDRLTTDFHPNKSCPKDWLHLSSHLPVVEPSRRPGRGGFQREHWRFERLLRPQPLEHYPGSSARKVCSDTWMTSFWRVIQRDAGFWKARSRGSRPGEARQRWSYGLWWRRGLLDAPSLGSDSLLPTKCMRLFKAVRQQLIQEGRFG